jgi:hypothetical protein
MGYRIRSFLNRSFMDYSGGTFINESHRYA